MNLRYITCSDIRECVPVQDAIKLLNISPKVELGIQAHGSAMNAGSPRYEWLNELLVISAKMEKPLNIAIHVNYDWCSQMALGREWPDEIAEFFFARHKNGRPLIRRWQLNIGDGARDINAHKLSKICSLFPDREFIFPYNVNNPVAGEIMRMHQADDCEFSLLYDASYGAGISPEKWYAPVYPDRPMGYAGGLSAENVADNLEKIAAVCPPDYTTWIDADGQLMKPNTHRVFDVERAAKYIMAALDWEKHQLQVKGK